jgi:alkylation response protein AidB-like acyl-CoA dehydrogenase
MTIHDWDQDPRVRLGPLGAEPPLDETESAIVDTVRKFAERIMRPTGIELDRRSPEEVIAAGSPFWNFREQFLELGINPEFFAGLTPRQHGRIMPMIIEELGWGDAGLTITIGACTLPPLMAAMFNKTNLLERYPPYLRGCWAITEPDHGSDSLDPNKQLFHPRGSYGRPNCIATIKGDQVVINGQKSAWVSNAPIAEVCILFCAADSGSGPDPERGVCVLIPMDAPGVTRGKSIDKLGQRTLPQGEIFFDDVTLGIDHIVAGPDDYRRAVYAIHADANGQMGALFTGVARAAYELAYAYAHERKQGGVSIFQHQSVAQRLFHMFRKVEASRALTRRVAMYNALNEIPALQAGMAVKVTATQTAFEVASEALQIFCGNGNTREYPIEKLFRDARASLIEDGCNEILSIKGGYYLMDRDLL